MVCPPDFRELSKEVLSTEMNSEPMSSLLAMASVAADGFLVGALNVGAMEGEDVGFMVGSVVGLNVGVRLGVFVGFKVGFSEGSNVGNSVGLFVVHCNRYIEKSLSTCRLVAQLATSS